MPEIKHNDSGNGVPSDPTSLRLFSILPDGDSDEGYCARHDQEMKQIDPILHTDGALYSTGENFSVYTCVGCISDISQGVPNAGMEAYQQALSSAFEAWDDGDTPTEWFQFVSEGTMGRVDP